MSAADASAIAARSNVPITSTTPASNVTNARGSIVQAQGGVAAAERELDAARARLTTAQARVREAEATAAKAARDVERLRGLLAKDEVSQQQFDTLVAAADASGAWYDGFPTHMTLPPRELAWSYIQRSGRIDPSRLRPISPRFVDG